MTNREYILNNLTNERLAESIIAWHIIKDCNSRYCRTCLLNNVNNCHDYGSVKLWLTEQHKD